MTFHEVLSKSALNHVPGASRMPFAWTINPYRGCSHACTYCFARGTHEYLDLDGGADFDTQIVVKVNVVEVLERELRRGAGSTRQSPSVRTPTRTSGPRGATPSCPASSRRWPRPAPRCRS